MKKGKHPERSFVHPMRVLSSAFRLLVGKWKSVVLAVLCFALIDGAGNVFINQRIDQAEQQLASDIGTTTEALWTQIAAEMSSLDEPRAQMLMDHTYAAMGIRHERSLTAEDYATLGAAPVYFATMTVYFAVALFFDVIVLFLAITFFLILATSGPLTGYEAAQRLPVTTFTMTGLVLWLFVRSLIWIPFAGIPLALFLLPRLSLSPVLHASGEFSPYVSTKESWKRTRGHWCSCAISGLCIIVACLLLLWIGGTIGGAVALFSPRIGFFVWLLTIMSVLAFGSFSLTILTAMLM